MRVRLFWTILGLALLTVIGCARLGAHYAISYWGVGAIFGTLAGAGLVALAGAFWTMVADDYRRWQYQDAEDRKQAEGSE